MDFEIIEVSQSSITLNIYCKPIPKARPRFSRGHVYTPSQTRVFENQLKYIFQKAFPHEPWTNEVSIQCYFYYKGTKKTLNRMKTTRPDLDNLIKSVKDAANGIIYNDDAQVASILSWKAYRDKDMIVCSFKKLSPV